MTNTPEHSHEQELLSAEELQEIAERARKATPGPWLVVYGDDEYCSSIYGVISQSEYERVQAGRIVDGEVQHRGDFPLDTKWATVDPGVAPVGGPGSDDMEFIAHSRADIPRLLATITERDAALAEIGRQRDALQEEVHWFQFKILDIFEGLVIIRDEGLQLDLPDLLDRMLQISEYSARPKGRQLLRIGYRCVVFPTQVCSEKH